MLFCACVKGKLWENFVANIPDFPRRSRLKTALVLHLCQSFMTFGNCWVSVYHTCEFLAEWHCDGSGFDQCCLADMLQILDVRNTVMVDKIVVFFGSGERSVDLVSQVLNAHVLVIRGFHQLFCVLERNSSLMSQSFDLDVERQGEIVIWSLHKWW